MSVTKEAFGKAPDGTPVDAYILDNGTITARVTNYGCLLLNLLVPDRNGEKADIVLGNDTIEPYYENRGCLGAVVGPSANRVGGASITIDGVEYHMLANDHGNNLHTNKETGFYKKVWKAEPVANGVVFTRDFADGEYGLPGNLHVQVTYELTADNGLKLHYHCSSDKKTLINMTNHSYFNLSGEGSGSIEHTQLQLFASYYTPASPVTLPDGTIAPVKGTVMDFLQPKEIGRDLYADTDQIRYCGGYDHNFCIDDWAGDHTLRMAARAYDAESGRVMEMLTTTPGFQFYTGNYLNERPGKHGHVYHNHDGFALETQYYPDNCHHPDWPQSVFGGDTAYDETTVYRFCTK